MGGRNFKKRVVASKPTRKRFLIICEGKETEPNYFNAFKEIGLWTKTAIIEVIPKKAVGITIVKQAKKCKNKDNTYDEIWCVFDRDAKDENNNQQNFNEAIQTAINEELNLAVSNDCFELWYLLHFDYYTSETHRSDFKKMLKTRLGEEYRKNDDAMYQKLLNKQEKAIQNAKKLWSSYESETDELAKYNKNPSTTVHLLVERLNKVIFSPLENIIRYLLIYQYNRESLENQGRNLREKLTTFRNQINNNLTDDLQNHLIGNLPFVYSYTKDSVQKEINCYTLSPSCPFTIEQILDKNYLP